MKIILPVALSIILLFYSYRPYSDTDHPVMQQNSKFFDIRYSDLVKKKQTVTLSQIASGVEYIKLETNPDCIIGQFPRFFFTDDMILVNNGGPVLKFSYSGKFLGEIFKTGRGPGEIDPLGNISLIPDKKLIVSQKNSQRKLLYFSYDGEFIRSVNYPENVFLIHVMPDGRFIYYHNGSPSNTKYSFLLTDERNDTISFVRNHKFWMNTYQREGGFVLEIGIGYPGFYPIYYHDNKIFFKSVYNDTIYTVSSNRIVPSYFVDLGKYRMADELIPERSISSGQGNSYREQAEKYYYANVLEASDRIFLAAYCYRSVEISPRYCLFDIPDQKGVTLVNSEGESTGIVNDWDGGLDFWPVNNVTDNKIYMPVSIMDLQNEFDKGKSVKFPGKQAELSEIISGSDILDNPIIMIVTLKSD